VRFLHDFDTRDMTYAKAGVSFLRNERHVKCEIGRLDAANSVTINVHGFGGSRRGEGALTSRVLFEGSKTDLSFPIPTYAMNTHWAEPRSHHQRTRTCHTLALFCCTFLDSGQCLPGRLDELFDRPEFVFSFLIWPRKIRTATIR
jgi:hypothetical protein